MTKLDRNAAGAGAASGSTPMVPGALTVAYVAPGWPAAACSNGIVTYTSHLRAGLEAAGHRVFVLARRLHEGASVGGESNGQGEASADAGVIDLQSERPPTMWTRRLSERWRATWRGTSPQLQRHRRQVLAAIRALHARHGVQLLEMEESFGLAAEIAGASPVPVVVRLHGPHFLVGGAEGVADTNAARQRIRAEGRGIRAAHAVTAPSAFVLEQARRHYDFNPPHAAVIANPMEHEPPKERWSLESAQRRTILFVGRFDRVKGGDVIIQAFGELWRRGVQSELIFAGPDRDGIRDDAGRTWSLPAYVEAHVPEAGQAHVHWLGFQPPTKLRALRQEAFVTVVPSRTETFGNTAVEAMALGCPLVVSNAGALPELVQDGRNGLHCEAGSPYDLAAKLQAVLAEPARAAALGAEAFRTCRDRYATDRVAAEMAAFYGEVIERWRGGPAGAAG